MGAVENKFSIEFAIDRELVNQSSIDLVKYEKEKHAAELGLTIADNKGWEETSLPFSDTNNVYRLSVYVFTPTELRAFIAEQVAKRIL